MNLSLLTNASTGHRPQGDSHTKPLPRHCPGQPQRGLSLKSTGYVGGHSIWMSYLVDYLSMVMLTVLSVGIMFLLVWAFMGYMDLPVVHVSSTTGKCVHVEQARNQSFTCTNLPTRYITDWAP